MPGLGQMREGLQVQDKQKLIIRGPADNHHLIQDDITSVKPVSVELKWSMSDEEFDEYTKAASQFLGSNAEFREESLRRFLKGNNILIYFLESVARLLKYKTKSSSPRLVCLIESERYKEMSKHIALAQFGNLLVSEQVFKGFIPLRVVQRIGLVLRKFPELYCLISLDECPETFVVVTFGKDSFEAFVIDMWNKDEPAVTKREE